MNETRATIPFSPEEFQRRLAELMRHQFPGGPTSSQAQAQAAGEPQTPAKDGTNDVFQFDYRPRDIKRYLDRFVIKQDEAKKVLSVAMCDHYHHVRLAMEGRAHPNYAKQNIILMGPTGVGKTYLIRSVAELIGVPFVKGDATKFSETGYVGGDVEDLVRELVRRANGDIARAEYGIIYIDEIDKIAASSSLTGRDVSGRGVQTNLLKLMEETEVPARAPNDIAGQIQAVMDFQRGKKAASVINTKHILFIVSGAFDGLERIVRQRLRESVIGFASPGVLPSATETLEKTQTRDFIEYGFEPEFIGRLPVRVVCHPLAVEDLYLILKDSEGSLLRQYEQDFQAFGIEPAFEEPALQLIAERAAEEQTGARGLMTVCERLFRDFKFELPSTCAKCLVVDEALVNDPKSALARLLEESKGSETFQARQAVHAFAQDFTTRHGLKIRFSDEAADQLVQLAAQAGLAPQAFCVERFKDFQFGLKLISQNTGQTEFILGVEAVAEPDKTLSGWVVASYRPAASAPESPSGAPGEA